MESEFFSFLRKIGPWLPLCSHVFFVSAVGIMLALCLQKLLGYCTCSQKCYCTKCWCLVFHYHLIVRVISSFIFKVLVFVFPPLFSTVEVSFEEGKQPNVTHLLFLKRSVAFSDTEKRIFMHKSRHTRSDCCACCCLLTTFSFFSFLIITTTLVMFFSYFPIKIRYGCRIVAADSAQLQWYCFNYSNFSEPFPIDCSDIANTNVSDRSVTCYSVSPALGLASGISLGLFKLLTYTVVAIVQVCRLWIKYWEELCYCSSKSVASYICSSLCGVIIGVIAIGLFVSIYFGSRNLLIPTDSGSSLLAQSMLLWPFILCGIPGLLSVPCLVSYYTDKPIFDSTESRHVCLQQEIQYGKNSRVIPLVAANGHVHNMSSKICSLDDHLNVIKGCGEESKPITSDEDAISCKTVVIDIKSLEGVDNQTE